MFVRYVSHEIRSPLNIVHMGLKLLKLNDNNPEFVKERLQTISDIEGSCDTAIQTLNGLLDYEKLEAGIMKLEKLKLLAWPIIRDAVRPCFVQVC